LDSPPHIKFPDDFTLQRTAGLHKVIKDLIGNMFMKNPLVPIGEKIEFQRLQLHYLTVWDILDPNCREIRLSGSGANGSKFRTGNVYDVFPTWILIRECL
jgi:hypothetical protein